MGRKLYVIIILVLLSEVIFPQEYKYYEYINANNVLMWVSGFGNNSNHPLTRDSGVFWNGSKNAKETCVFADGVLLGFYFGDSIHIHGSVYRGGLNPIPFYGSFVDSIPVISKVRKNWKVTVNPQEYEFYRLHHENYPYWLGAPYIDHDNNGYYDPEIDVPDNPGDEMLWWTSFANDSIRSRSLYGSGPLKLEIQRTMWGENTIFPDVIYKKFVIINHESEPLENFYFGYWSDTDLGHATDDNTGIDTTLNLAFHYNGDEYDDFQYLDEPASVGWMLLDGPIVSASSDDTARAGKYTLPGKKNLPLTSYQFVINADFLYSEPNLGDYRSAPVTYEILKGNIWTGDPVIDPVSGETTKFPLAGDPIAKTGWFEGEGWPNGPPPGQRRWYISSGPFTLAAGDTQFVTMAFLAARDTGRLNSLAKLKQLACDVQYHWLYEVERTFPEPKRVERNEEEIPENFIISNNYPNPFNKLTNINLELPQSGNIKIVIYNALGEMVGEVNDHFPTAGFKNIQFNGAGLSSGVYYYTVLFRGETKLGKFVMLK